MLVAIDTSEQCQSVFGRAIELAQVCAARLYLLHCLIMDPSPEPTIPAVPNGMSDLGLYPRLIDNLAWQEQVQEQKRQAMALLQTYRETAIGMGIETESACQVGDPGRCLCDLASSWEADLIVMGRRGRQGISEALLGSISNYVVHHAPCAVLVIQ